MAAAPCPWCAAAVASHNHVMWECPSRPLKPETPSDAFTARFSWPGPEETKQRARKRLAAVVCLAWEATAKRYGAKGEEQKAASLRKALNDEGYATTAGRPVRDADERPSAAPPTKRQKKRGE